MSASLFPDRLREADLEPEQLEPAKLETAIADFVSAQAIDALPDLVRLSHRDHSSAPDVERTFRQSLQESVAAFPLRGEDQLVEVCAAQGVLLGFEDLGRQGRNVLALSTLSNGFRGIEPAHPDVLVTARVTLQQEAVDVRKPPPRPRLPKTGSRSAAALAAARESEDPRSALEVCAAVIGEQETMRSSYGKVVTYATRARTLADESAGFLWWLVSEGSETQAQPLANFQAADLAALVAIDLDALTRFVPGPFSSSQLLTRAIQGGNGEPTDEVPVSEMRQALLSLGSPVSVPPERLAEFFPLHLGASEGQASLVALASQAYFELQLFRAWEG